MKILPRLPITRRTECLGAGFKQQKRHIAHNMNRGFDNKLFKNLMYAYRNVYTTPGMTTP